MMDFTTLLANQPDDAALPIEQLLTVERFRNMQGKTEENFGASETEGAKAVTDFCFERLTAAVAEDRAQKHYGSSGVAEIHRLLSDLDTDTITACILYGALDAIPQQQTYNGAAIALGHSLWWEAWSHELVSTNKKQATKLAKKARDGAGNLDVRRTAFRALAKRKGLTGKKWDVRVMAKVGLWGFELLMATLPDVFVKVDVGNERRVNPSEKSKKVPGYHTYVIELTPEGLDRAHDAFDRAMLQRPVFIPSLEQPAPWSALREGGPADPRMQGFAKLVRTHQKSKQALLATAIRNGQMQPALDALNAIQNTAWTINRRVLEVAEECMAKGIAVASLPTADIAIPQCPTAFLELPAGQRNDWEERAASLTKQHNLQPPMNGKTFYGLYWRRKGAKAHEKNRTLTTDRLSVGRDLKVANVLKDAPRFYTPHNMDWRGRVYPLPFFNFQRSDLVRSLHLFADGEPIGEEGLWWLKVHVANCGDFDKISKQPFEERVQWTDNNAAVIREIAASPLAAHALGVWTTADQPFLFLAACMELGAAVAQGPSFVSRLPLSWDGSCSGLQHLCAMTRAPEGSLVNLTPTDKPADVYQTVADVVQRAVWEDHTNRTAKDFLDFGIDRSLVKRNVMTYAYSSKKFGMAEQQREDLMKPLANEVLEGKREAHPFGDDDGLSASVYIAEKVHTAIEQVVKRPAEAMGFLQQLAQAMAEENKPLRWITPAGIPWENRYHDPVIARVQLFLRNAPVRLSVTTGDKRAINRAKVTSAVAPNFVHACDAAHLLLTVNNCVKEGITSFGLVHDSFGCLASRSAQMHRIIRQTMVEMYETHDVLAEVLASARADLEDTREDLPTPPAHGGLNIKDLLNARYAFA
jgi:DNA-directed RNA polymerase